MTLDDIAIFIIIVLCIQAFLMQFGECEGWFFDKKNWKRRGDKNNNKRKARRDEALRHEAR